MGDALADYSKHFPLQRHAKCINADERASPMQGSVCDGVGKTSINIRTT